MLKLEWFCATYDNLVRVACLVVCSYCGSTNRFTMTIATSLFTFTRQGNATRAIIATTTAGLQRLEQLPRLPGSVVSLLGIFLMTPAGPETHDEPIPTSRPSRRTLICAPRALRFSLKDNAEGCRVAGTIFGNGIVGEWVATTIDAKLSHIFLTLQENRDFG